jgi:hypothetical protein
MKRYLALALVLCAVSVGLLAAQTGKPAAAAAEGSAVQADRALGAAFEKGNSATVNKLLDAEFTWIDTDGIMWERPDALRAGLKPLVPNAGPNAGGDVKTIEHKYANGKVVWIQNNQGNKYAAHIWVQRPAGWRLLHANEIETRPADPVANVRPAYAIPCINPCKEVPYKPISASEKAALAGWQDQEGANGPGHHDMHIGENVVVISSTTTTPRASATAQGPTPVSPAAANRPQVGAAPALWARTWDFGDAVVAIMIQPTYGGKAYWSSRIFGNHNGFWKMEESYHTTIQASPRMTALPMPAEQASR